MTITTKAANEIKEGDALIERDGSLLVIRHVYTDNCSAGFRTFIFEPSLMTNVNSLNTSDDTRYRVVVPEEL